MRLGFYLFSFVILLGDHRPDNTFLIYRNKAGDGGMGDSIQTGITKASEGSGECIVLKESFLQNET